MHRRRRQDAGYATVEAALAIQSLVLFTMALAGVLTGLATQIRCLDAARLGARAAARGESATEVQAAVGRAMPGASVHIGTEDGLIRVTVTAPVADVPLLRAFTAHADAYEADEATDEATVESEDTDADPNP